MRILFVTPQPPFPPQKGTTLRNAALLAEAARFHEVHLLTIGDSAPPFAPRPPRLASAEAVPDLPTAVVPPPRRTAARRLADLVGSALPDLVLRLRTPAAHERFVALLRAWRPDVVQFEAVEAAGAVGPLGEAFRAAGYRPRLIYDAHNAEFALQERIWRTEIGDPRRLPFALYSLIQWRRLRRWEAGLCRAATVIAVSEGDAARLEELAGVRPVVIPNGVDTDRYAPSPSGPALNPEAPCLLFVGTLDFRPNVDAVTWFAREVLPLIVPEFPKARFVIAGRDPAPAVRALAGPHVEVVGPVEDERPLLGSASIYVVPMRSGGGMRFKVVQAMAAGVPVVTTTFGADGVAARHGEHLLMADTPAAFRDAIRRTLRDPQATRRRVARARALVVERYDWRAILPALAALYDRLAAEIQAGRAA
ncbi:MAG: glycosyltransferase family 4 protein [Chloroflexota bacterium]|nr:glycosyltransferase family 4 protein [Dehalococcoidia bacterium]MDW8255238.1 glycosyltransferase family 4 protein [Chloroflexota bacterium]